MPTLLKVNYLDGDLSVLRDPGTHPLEGRCAPNCAPVSLSVIQQVGLKRNVSGILQETVFRVLATTVFSSLPLLYFHFFSTLHIHSSHSSVYM